MQLSNEQLEEVATKIVDLMCLYEIRDQSTLHSFYPEEEALNLTKTMLERSEGREYLIQLIINDDELKLETQFDLLKKIINLENKTNQYAVDLFKYKPIQNCENINNNLDQLLEVDKSKEALEYVLSIKESKKDFCLTEEQENFYKQKYQENILDIKQLNQTFRNNINYNVLDIYISEENQEETFIKYDYEVKLDKELIFKGVESIDLQSLEDLTKIDKNNIKIHIENTINSRTFYEIINKVDLNECSSVLKNIVENLYFSENDMFWIEVEDLEDGEIIEEELLLLKQEITKYHLEDVLEVCTSLEESQNVGWCVQAYGNLDTKFNLVSMYQEDKKPSLIANLTEKQSEVKHEGNERSKAVSKER